MPEIALALFVGYVAVVFVGRALLLRQRTGQAGWHGISGPVGSAGWWGGILFAAALVGALLAPAADLAGAVEPVAGLDGRVGHVAGLVLFGLGFAGSLAAQRAMGAWWRVGVDNDEDVDLVARGPFGLVRNPFFSALGLSAVGLLLLVPNVIALLALVALVVAVELQVRVVEEPFLQAQHGARYRAYTTRVGRFVPGVGRTREAART